MKLDTQAQVDAAEKTLRLSWVIVAGAVLFSVLTVTPLVQRVTPDGWGLTAPILPIVVDAAVVIVVRVDAIVARLDGEAGFWPALLRWLTGLMTLALNVGDSALKGDLVGVGVHSVAPILLIVTAEAGLKWRRAITTAVERIQREHQADRERERLELREREDRERADRERDQEVARAERERREAADRERREQEAADRQSEREHTARVAREEREHAAELERQREERADARHREEQDRADRERREEHARQEAVQKAKEAAQRTERERKASEARKASPAPVSAAVSTTRPTVSTLVSTTAHDDAPVKVTEAEARQAVADAIREGRSQRQVAALTGWSTGWVAKAFRDLGEVAA
ncbi:coiled-coil domain-containing protein [Streptomyces prunicolor]|uniref:DUF2637 domain-containing protein n=1 Tax=Streptomyces prunicolor TaxID=67348 RepID=A0ABU4FQ61_9ACTN|nr:hypothetical protein [Streptomyces prunicolor]MDV7222746.1 hypothetical protein [Streptomyces prunicolor]